MAYPRATSNSAHYVGVGKQSVKGTPVAPTVFVPYKGAVTLDHGMAGEDIREAGLGPYVSRTMKTAHDPTGGFGLAVRPSTVAKLLTWMLGSDGISGSGPYVHVITPDEAARTWLTIEQNAGTSGDIIDRFGDCLIKSAKFSCDGNQDLMVEFGWFGLTPAWQATVTSTSYESGISGLTPGGPFRGSEADFAIDGSAATNVQSWEVAFEWKYDEDIRLSEVTRGDALKLELAGTVKVKQLIDSSTMVNQYRKTNYGSTTGTAADRNFYTDGDFSASYNNGLLTTNTRAVTVLAPNIDWKKAKYTDLNPDGSTMYLEREGVLTKLSGSELVAVTFTTGDSAQYD
jgi:hypothetical protein